MPNDVQVSLTSGELVGASSVIVDGGSYNTFARQDDRSHLVEDVDLCSLCLK